MSFMQAFVFYSLVILCIFYGPFFIFLMLNYKKYLFCYIATSYTYHTLLNYFIASELRKNQNTLINRD